MLIQISDEGWECIIAYASMNNNNVKAIYLFYE